MSARCGYSNINKSGTTVLRGKKAIRIASTSGGDNNESIANYALIENTNGTRDIYSWGYNGYGQLGHNDTSNRSQPTQISLNASVYGRIVEIWATGGNYGYLMVLMTKDIYIVLDIMDMVSVVVVILLTKIIECKQG